MRLDRRAIDALDDRRRIALINSISGLRPAVLVATADAGRRSNLAVMNSLMHVGARPPLLGLLFRPDTVERHTLENIRATDVYTVNHVHGGIIDAAHQSSARYPRDVSEFDAVGLTAEWLDGFEAPFVAEARVRLALRLCEERTLRSNGTHLVIGELSLLECPDDTVTDTGSFDPAVADSLAVAGLDAYYRGQAVARLAHARADTPPQRIEVASPSAD
jgi:flavin reductase (DIM6/NTAB) family NADH-FMN oxidoreductase RutF